MKCSAGEPRAVLEPSQMGRGFRGSHGSITPVITAESTVVFNHSHPVNPADDPNASVCPASTIHGAAPPPARRLRLRPARVITLPQPNGRLTGQSSGTNKRCPENHRGRSCVPKAHISVREIRSRSASIQDRISRTETHRPLVEVTDRPFGAGENRVAEIARESDP